MKRIFYITATTKRDGPGNQLGWLIERLDRTRFEPTVVTVLGGGEWDVRYRQLGVKRIDLGLRKPLDLFAPLRLLALLKREKPDLVQTQMLRADIYGRWAAAFTQVPYITVVQNMDVWKRSGRLFDRYAAWLDARQLKRARAIVAVSNAVARDCMARQGIKETLIKVIPNSVDVKRFLGPFTSTDRAHWRTSVGVPMDSLVISDTGRFTAQKAPDVWLAAAALVLHTRPAVHFVHANAGPLLSPTREQATRLGIRNHLHFVGERGDIPQLLHASDIFVLDSRFEGLPTALMEAMVAGLPCVASNVSGNPELIQDGETGLLVPPDQPRVLADALIKLIDDAALRARLGAAARDFASKQCDAVQMAQSFLALYDRILP